MKPTVLGIVIVLALLAAGAIFFASDALAPAETAAVEQTYANDLLGISFSYPTGYLLSESSATEGANERYTITIIADEDAVPRVNSEGPTAITIEAYSYAEPVTLSVWLTKNESNVALGDGQLSSTTVDGAEAVRYDWSGLYEGETTAFVVGSRVVAVSVTYQSPADRIYEDYLMVLSSLRIR